MFSSLRRHWRRRWRHASCPVVVDVDVAVALPSLVSIKGLPNVVAAPVQLQRRRRQRQLIDKRHTGNSIKNKSLKPPKNEMTSMRGIGTVAILVLLSTAATLARELGEPLSPKVLEEMLDNDDVKILFDFRQNASRDADGYIQTSVLVPEELNLAAVKSGARSDVIPTGNK